MARRIVILGALTLMISAGVAAASCSDGGSKPSANGGTAVSTPVPAATRAAVPPESKTAAAVGGDVPLVPYADPNKRFTASIPQGWQAEDKPDALQLTLPGDPVLATIGIVCDPGQTADDLIAEDARIAAQFNSGNLDPATAKSTEVAGQPARTIAWSGGILGSKLNVDHVSVYFEGKGCAWRIGLSVFPGGDLQGMETVLGQVLAGFRLT